MECIWIHLDKADRSLNVLYSLLARNNACQSKLSCYYTNLLIYPIITYGSVVLESSLKMLLERLQILQNKQLRKLIWATYYDS